MCRNSGDHTDTGRVMELPIQSMVASARKIVGRSSADKSEASDRPLRVLAIHRYYWPDTPPYASILRTIAARWVALGHHVDVLTSQPSYKPEAGIGARRSTELVDDVSVKRITLPSDRVSRLQKLINTAAFPTIVFLRIVFGRRHDFVMCSTAPPVLLGLGVAIATKIRQAKFIYHCMDIHPEIGALSGDFANPLLYRLLRSLDEWTCRQATSIVVLSKDMADVLVQRDSRVKDRVEIINNFDLPDYADSASDAALPLAAHSPSETIRIIFAGNLGRFQGLQDIVRAAMSLEGGIGGLEIVFMGDGSAKEELVALSAEAENRNSNTRVRFLPHGTPTEARVLMRSADFGLVPLIPGVVRYAYPSKVATYLSEGLPVIAIVEDDSELARLVSDESIGYVAPPRNAAALTKVLGHVASSQNSLPAMRAGANRVATERFSRETRLERWTELLVQLIEQK